MDKERYLNYIAPSIPHVDWSKEQLDDEVEWLAKHRIETNPIGERALQLTVRMRLATGEQQIRYNQQHG